MTINLRSDSTFVQEEGWYVAANRYDDFVCRHENLHILYLELGVGANTLSIIKYMVDDGKKSEGYLCLYQLWRGNSTE